MYKIYALKWKQTGKISTVEAYTSYGEAQKNAYLNNKRLKPSILQKVLCRYWMVVTINVKEG